ncbi:MAG: hypothetical protein HWN67_15320 [Candidatus Helarchaeota archaeon]|nr:hypothetical protein [Candidatus Helarchaeota archaeon]
MISTGQLLVTFLLIGRLFLYPIGAFILLQQWYKGKVRYYSDLPFIFAFVLIVMCIYTPIELYFVAFYPAVSIESPIGQIAYLIDLNLNTVVYGLNFAIMLVVWFPTHKKKILLSIIIWIIFTEIAILIAAFVNIAIMDILLVVIGLPMYLIFVFTFFFCYNQKRLPNIHPLLIGSGMTTILIAHLIHSVLGQMGIRLAGIYTDAVWPAMIIWLAGFLIMIIGFIKKAPYYEKI